LAVFQDDTSPPLSTQLWVRLGYSFLNKNMFKVSVC
jgi:hypothetical protein